MVAFIVSLLAVTPMVQGVGVRTDQIRIVDTAYVPFVRTSYDAGPSVGDMLNWHFFPGVNHYVGGHYSQAMVQLTYVIRRPAYIAENPRQGEFMSTSHFLRGMVYAYHAAGVGRYSLAKEDFEAAIEWNSRNFPAYIELSRVYSTLGLAGEASRVLEYLLELEPDQETVDEAKGALAAITQTEETQSEVTDR